MKGARNSSFFYNMNNLVYGKGINDLHGYRNTKVYMSWIRMLDRCYSGKFKSYINCEVCDEWLYFSNFKKWFDANYIEGFDLDKDILIKGNKVYSPETSRYVPRYLNSLVISSNLYTKSCPLGVRKTDNKYQVRLNVNNKSICVGRFDTVEEASNVYIIKRLEYIKNTAIESFLSGEIMSDIATSLIEWEIN